MAIHPRVQQQREELRLEALGRYRLLDTAPEESFDRITKLAAIRLKAPIATVGLVDRDRVWFKSRYGLDLEETPFDVLASDPLLPDEPLWIGDTRNTREALPRELSHSVRFYAAAPLKTYNGFTLGSLCVMDEEPHAFDPQLLGELSDLATSLMRQIETRRLKMRYHRSRSVFRPKAQRHHKAASPHRQTSHRGTPRETWPCGETRNVTTDRVTGLMDRFSMLDRLDQWHSGSVGETSEGALLLIDIQGFRRFNQQHGYEAGDKILVEIGRRLERLASPGEIVTRLESDRFGLFAQQIHGLEHARDLMRHVKRELSRSFSLGQVDHRIEVRVAGTLARTEAGSASEETSFRRLSHHLLSQAEQALAEARDKGLDLRLLSWESTKESEENRKLSNNRNQGHTHQALEDVEGLRLGILFPKPVDLGKLKELLESGELWSNRTSTH